MGHLDLFKCGKPGFSFEQADPQSLCRAFCRRFANDWGSRDAQVRAYVPEYLASRITPTFRVKLVGPRCGNE